MRIGSSALFILRFGVFLCFTDAFRLNVPRVLLPYHPSAQVKFDLIVTDPEGGCFKWRSTRPDIVSVLMIDGADSCSDRAQIAATSKHATLQTAMVFAEDTAAGVVLSCGVTVDVIKRISISTTTKVLFLDASPAKMAVHAYNYEGDTFSNMGGIPFEWHIEPASLTERPLRIVPFSQSKYEAPEGIRDLEENKTRGYVVLVEGVSTGAAKLRAQLSESFFKDVKSHSIELLVVANLLLVPSVDLYLPLGAVVQYSAEIVKQDSTEPISLPSKQYQLKIADSSICSLDVATSRVFASALGSTEISLVDENVRSNVLKPPSAHIYVVQPVALMFSISGGSWYLEAGRDYFISVLVTDADDNGLYIPGNAQFMTVIPESHFKILEKSANSTYFHVKATVNGVVKLRSSFVSVLSSDGKELRISSTVKGDQTATILDPIEVVPKLIVFPYISKKVVHSFKLQARGGSGAFSWSSLDSEIATVDSAGLLTSGNVGETQVSARDLRNPAHIGDAIVRVLHPFKLSFGKSPFEAEVGKSLTLSLAMFVGSEDHPYRVNECRHVNFTFVIADTAIFEIDAGAPKSILPYGDGCSSVTLNALSSGDTTVTFFFGSISASAQISSYMPLKLEAPQNVLLLLGSEFDIKSTGGPRAWILDPSKYFSKLEYSESVKLISHRSEQNRHRIICDGAKGDIVVHLRMGNEPTSSNPLPATSEAQLRVCCGVPSRLTLSVVRSKLKGMAACPKSSNVIYMKEQSKLALGAFGRCESGPSAGTERMFDSVSALEVNWSTDEPKLLEVSQIPSGNKSSSRIFAFLKPQGKPGASEVVAKVEEFSVNDKKKKLPNKLWAALDTLLVDRAHISPSDVIIWNEKATKKTVEIVSGSKFFALAGGYENSVVHVNVNRDSIEISPLQLGKTEIILADLCLENRFSATVTVTDVHSVAIEAPDYVQVGNESPLKLSVYDASGMAFSADDVSLMNLQIEYSSEAVSVNKIDALNYRITGNAVGSTTLVAIANTANGNPLRSLPHEVQIFAPLQLRPKVVTLIPDSVFQFEVIGGPQPNPAVLFTLNDSSVAVVAVNGLITSQKIGYTSVVGSVDIGVSGLSKDCAVIKVVSLAGIRIRLSSARLQRGGKAWARIEGLADDETPFAFGGATYPLRVTWSVGAPGVAEITSFLGPSVRERPENQIQIALNAIHAGQTELKVSVKVDSRAVGHFKKGTVFEDQVAIAVIEPLELVEPNIPLNPIRMTPHSDVSLETNRVDGTVLFSVPSQFTNYVSIGGDAGTTLHAQTIGDAAISVRQTSVVHNETSFIPVSILPLHSVHLDLLTALPLPMDGVPLTALPLGYQISVKATFRDYAGRAFHAAKVEMRYRPHRFDLADISSRSVNRVFHINLKQPGETILMVWDQSNPVMNAFLRIPVVNVIKPAITSVLSSDIVCFKSPLESKTWKEVASRRHFTFVDADEGIAIAREPGYAVISSTVSNQTIFTELTVTAVEGLHFGEVPHFVSNIRNKQYFPVYLGNSSNAINIHGCDASDMKILDGHYAPFDCLVTFNKEAPVSAQSIIRASALFSRKTGSYSCVLEEQPFDSPATLIESSQLFVVVKAVLNQGGGKVLETEVKAEFFPRFRVVQKEIRLNNVHSLEAELSIEVPDATASAMKLEGCHDKILNIVKEKSSIPATQFYKVKLNLNSAVLWRELLDKCNISIRNAKTGQTEEVPVSIALHGDASKAVLRASEGLLSYLAGLAEYSIMFLSTLIVAVVSVFLFLAYRKGYPIFPFIFGSSSYAQPGVAGVFASDRPSPSPGYAAWRLMNQPLSSTPAGGLGRRSEVVNRISPGISSLSSSANRSAGSAGEPFLWSISDSLNSPADLRNKRR